MNIQTVRIRGTVKSEHRVTRYYDGYYYSNVISAYHPKQDTYGNEAGLSLGFRASWEAIFNVLLKCTCDHLQPPI